MRPSTANDSEQLDPRCSTTDIPPPQSTTLGLHPVACKLLLISRPAEGHTYSCFMAILHIYQRPTLQKTLLTTARTVCYRVADVPHEPSINALRVRHHSNFYSMYIVFRKKHPLTFSFISPWKMFTFTQKFLDMFFRH